jgi:hypothetical protein
MSRHLEELTASGASASRFTKKDAPDRHLLTSSVPAITCGLCRKSFEAGPEHCPYCHLRVPGRRYVPRRPSGPPTAAGARRSAGSSRSASAGSSRTASAAARPEAGRTMSRLFP